ncbi:MAG: carbohydrate ABC transporter permease [Deltaproteobacteria bacterium]|nr:carbohydrate ABC transporter permease [Deltaproteobacteria bacterium]
MSRKLFFAALLLGLLAYCSFPLLWLVATSLKPGAEVARLPPVLPWHPTLENYRAVFAGHSLLRVILNSAVVAGSTTVLALVLGSLAAFALAKLRVPRSGAVLGFVLASTMFPAIATVSPLFIVIRALRLRDTVWALILTYTTFSLPLAIWVLTSFFREVPEEILRAARVDGCSSFQVFRRIVLPLATPGLGTTAILVFINAWNEFLYALTFTASDASRTIPVAIALFAGQRELPWAEISAASVIATAPLAVLVFAFQRRIVEGLTAGSVKG